MSQPRHREPLPFGGVGSPPYSKGLMARALIAVGVPAESAYELARNAERDLAAHPGQPLDLGRLHELAVETLGESEGAAAIVRLRRYRELQELDLPIILLVGGTTGTGKSTVATDAAYRLGIARVTSTDFIRQTMRAFFSHEFMPSIHYSSFDAGLGLAAAGHEGHDLVLDGFLDQTRNVLVGVRAAVDRALHEGWSMVLEGVHLVPGMLEISHEDALVVQCVLAIDDKQTHAEHFFIRDTATDGVRPMSKYLDHLPEIRRIQRYVVERAERHGVPVLQSGGIDQTSMALLELVFDRVASLETTV
jgi:2-phosphoglycerate kinase